MRGSWRLFSRRLHLWLGLSVGTILVLISLSGAAIVFYVELDRWLHPELQAQSTHSGEPDWDQAVKTLRAAYPDKTGPWRLEVTPDQQLIPARYNKLQETHGNTSPRCWCGCLRTVGRFCDRIFGASRS